MNDRKGVNQSKLTIRIPTEVKDAAEEVLKGIGVNMTTAIEVYLRQIVYTQGLPIDAKLPQMRIIEHDLTHHTDRIDPLLERGCSQMEQGWTKTIDACPGVLFTEEAARDYERITVHAIDEETSEEHALVTQAAVAGAINRLFRSRVRHAEYQNTRKFDTTIRMLPVGGNCVFYVKEDWRDQGDEVVVIRIINFGFPSLFKVWELGK